MSIYTDTNKLLSRIDAHRNYSEYDINEWILQKVALKNGETLLDLGCGTGEQLLKFAKNCPTSNLIGIDISPDSLKIIQEYCTKNEIKNVKTLLGNVDNLPSLLNTNNNFDVVSSSFALYYSNNISKLISIIKKILSPKGRFFVCGPVLGNNAELIEFQSQISKSVLNKTRYVMTDEILPEILKNFSNVSQDYFYNPIRFPDAMSLIQYWKSYYLYDSTIEEEFTQNVKKYYTTHKEFVTTKKVLGILANK